MITGRQIQSESSIRLRTPEEQFAAAFADSRGPGKRTEQGYRCREAVGLFERVKPATDRLTRLVVQLRKNTSLREGFCFPRLRNGPSGPKRGVQHISRHSLGHDQPPCQLGETREGPQPSTPSFRWTIPPASGSWQLDKHLRYVPPLQILSTWHRLMS